jgi:hypothetical protein
MLEPELAVGARLAGADAERLFPTIDIVTFVKRRQSFYQLNAAAPFGFFSLLSLLQFSVQTDEEAEQTGYSLDSINHRERSAVRIQCLGCSPVAP